MKPLARILVPLAGDVGDGAALALAGEIARPFEAHVSTVFFRIDPLSLSMIYTEPCALGPVLEVIEEQETQAARNNQVLFQDWCAREGFATEACDGRVVASRSECEGGEGREIAALGRLSDLAVVSGRTDSSGRTKAMFEAALFDTGRPVVLAPAQARNPLSGTAVIAWNGSLESARALSGALPLLALCERVAVFTRAEHNKPEASADDAIAFLHAHQIAAEALRPAAGESGDVADQLAAACGKLDAGLLVMGAYARGRLREQVFGGVTRHMLNSGFEGAVLMAH